MNFSIRSPRVLLSTAVALASATSAMGVSAQAPGMLEEVIVTAAKREQTLQEVPVAVSVVTSESIEQAQVLDIKDLQTLVPSLRVTQLQGSAQTNFIIRGVGNGANNAGIEPSVGVFIDPPLYPISPLPFPLITTHPFPHPIMQPFLLPPLPSPPTLRHVTAYLPPCLPGHTW